MTRIQGKFVWFELITDRIVEGEAFYTKLLGWTLAPMPIGGTMYDAFKNGDTAIGGFVKPQGDPKKSHWASYLSVEDVDDRRKAVLEGGGQAPAPAFDLAEVGRVAPVADAQGIPFMLFASAHGDPEDQPSVVGGWHWNELWSSDASAAAAFYQKTLGYEVDTMAMPEGTYYILKTGGAPRAGVLQIPSAQVPTKWLPYVHVQNCDDTLRHAVELGATKRKDCTDIPGVGRFAIFTDPTGATLGIIKPQRP